MRLIGLAAIGLLLMLLFTQTVLSSNISVADEQNDGNKASLLEKERGDESNYDVVDKEEYEDDDYYIRGVKPVAVFDYTPVNPRVDDVVCFNGEKSYDVDGEIVSYRWSYTVAGVSHFPVIMGSGEKVTYSWGKPGDYQVVLEVTDNDGFVGVSQKKVHVEKPLIPPSADFTFNPSAPKVGETVSFDGSKSSDDGEIVQYSWSYTTIGVSHPPVAIGTGKTVGYSWSEAGDYLVILEVTDNDGLTGSVNKEIHVDDDVSPPSADFIFNPSNPRVGETVTFDATGSVDDKGIVAYEWDFGDGTAGFGKVVNHSYDSAAGYIVKLRVTDEDGLEDFCSKTVNVEEDVGDDTDGDGLPDSVDEDDDNDGWSDEEETEYGTDPKDADSYPLDTDGDGVPDCVDEDDDNDGWSDEEEDEKGTDPKDPENHPEESSDDENTDEENESSSSHHSRRYYTRHAAVEVEAESVQSSNIENFTSNEEQVNESTVSYTAPMENNEEGDSVFYDEIFQSSGMEKTFSNEKDYTLFYYVIGVVTVLVVTLLFLPRKKEEKKEEVVDQNQFSFVAEKDSKEEIVYVPKHSKVVSEIFLS